jgi:ATP-binding cassette subfamily B protein
MDKYKTSLSSKVFKTKHTDASRGKIIYSFIPQHISNKMVLHFFDALWKASHIFMSRKKIEYNFNHNRDELQKMNVAKQAYIEKQAQWKNVAFGSGKKSDMAYSGCEIIAVYNALLALKANISQNTMPELISYFERNGAVLLGTFGTSPRALYRYFYRNHYDAVIDDTTENDRINAIGEKYDVFLASFYNDKYNINNMIHTVCITKDMSGKYTAHNAYTRDINGGFTHTAEYDTLAEMINSLGSNPKVICTIGIKS